MVGGTSTSHFCKLKTSRLTGFQKWRKLVSELSMAQDLAQLFVADLGSSCVRITGCANLADVPFKKLVNGLIERGAKFHLISPTAS